MYSTKMESPRHAEEYSITTHVAFVDSRRTEEDELEDERRDRRGLTPIPPIPDWFTEVHCEVHTQSDSNVIGTCRAALLDFESARSQEDSDSAEDYDFRTAMAAASESYRRRYFSTGRLADDLFDWEGELREKWYHSSFPETRGTGVWGMELDSVRNVLLIEFLHVDEDWREEGLGTKIVQDVLDQTYRHLGEDIYVFARPGVTDGEGSRVLCNISRATKMQVSYDDQILRSAERFWRARGFRRVGRSRWLAYTTNEQHPSRQVTVAEDAAVDHGLPGFGMRPEWQSVVPAHLAALVRDLGKRHKTDTDCLNLLKEVLPKDRNHDDWLVRGEFGNTLLHLAALSSKPETIQFVLKRKPSLAWTKNLRGDTPLQALHQRLHAARPEKATRENWHARTGSLAGAMMPVFREQLVEAWRSDNKFEGFGENVVESVCLLSRTPFVSLGRLSQEAVCDIEEVSGLVKKMLRLKYWCTCGGCLGGWLSPRNQLVLRRVALDLRDSCEQDLEKLPFETWFDRYESEFLLGSLITKDDTEDNKRAALWILNVCDALEDCIYGDEDTPARVPTPTRILAGMRGVRQHTTDQPGDLTWQRKAVAAVAEALAIRADKKWEDLQNYEDEWVMEENERLQESVEKLPVCTNDGYLRPFYPLWGKTRPDFMFSSWE
ncbi:hypothetical protein QBC40DRAFT_320008 [Triangularia verruculosa]|uniref:N-acetyltransferase domain-containing protein n=1 Tax=Triangularia verruculosa TaxID=2587418 RepID=A0AAN6X7K2_9PEZI|nr:hypothetical protein QBC40DRAFT_320008 [Triangularia verruculosa]